ncbi:MAG: hypothetical protein UR68_C0046G0005 [Candidatus Roizmanbacteria bacterium GW2011_GWA2_35_19]|uniref:Uncharacterized protein n=1 Tax=Candidatus Roizmanbacteria bacterium GW2011_GWA2_35_19 TaxID=1618478 RepID=A0A0G0ERU2_9BACT|nr:MAG: hypothetical protein UR68_C0046G0005 [Candidatus Roizmanbacteria bacterium GW2011_GWA2_35_19]
MSENPKLIVANWKKSGSGELIEPWLKKIGPLAQGLGAGRVNMTF